MVFVPGGTFTMGSESQAHPVTLDAYYIDRYEVTNALWAACVEAGGCDLPAVTADYAGEPYYDNEDRAGYPVVNVTWFQAEAYCAWRGARLPTEAEWEMAARWDPDLDTVTLYPWGNTWVPSNLNYCDTSCLLSNADSSYNDGWPQTAPIGSFLAGVSPVGAYDMAGNVSEWVLDWYDASYYAVSPSENPTGPALGTQRVIRGGAWGVSNPLLLRSDSRYRYEPEGSGPGTGFRCAISIPESEP
jgi:formylglycine-generating enzyme required for sulfatase activity